MSLELSMEPDATGELTAYNKEQNYANMNGHYMFNLLRRFPTTKDRLDKSNNGKPVIGTYLEKPMSHHEASRT